MLLRVKSKYRIVASIALILVIASGILAFASGDSYWTDEGNYDTTWYDPTYTTYYIESSKSLAGVAKLVNDGTTDFAGKILEIGYQDGTPIESLDFQGHLWVPIGTEEKPFKGFLSGKTGTIVTLQNMNIKGDYPYAGFVGYMNNGALLAGLTFSGGSINIDADNDVYVGAAVGKMTVDSTVINITNDNPINVQSSGQSFVGGIVGAGEKSTVSRSRNNASVTVAGKNDSTRLFSLLFLERNEEILFEEAESELAEGVILETAENNALRTTDSDTVDEEVVEAVTIETGSDESEALNGTEVDEEVSESLEETILITQLQRQSRSTGKNVYVGGIIGFVDLAGMIVKEVTNDGKGHIVASGVADVYAGGIAGYANGKLEMHDQDTNIVNRGNVTINDANRAYVGGVAGKAHGHITFSAKTVNTGTLSNSSSNSNLSAVGGLLGSMGSLLGQQAQINIPYTNNVQVINNGGTNVYTGGLVGLAEANIYFGHEAKNNGLLTVSGNEAYTGGLIGFVTKQLFLENTEEDAYENNGLIEVTNGNGLYTGGIVSNRMYTRTNGGSEAITNVHSNATISVTGGTKVYTGGFIGQLTEDGTEKTIYHAKFSKEINVNATGEIFTGGIVGYYNATEKIQDVAFTGKITVSGGHEDTTFTGGLVGVLAKGTIVNSNVGHTKATHAQITASGSIGGVVGKLENRTSSIVDQTNAKHITLTAIDDNGVIGGVVGKTNGIITNTVVGNEAYSSVTINTANDRKQLTAGGIAGKVLQEGTIGVITSRDQVLVKNISLVTKAENSDSHIGGAIGYNESNNVFLEVESLDIVVNATPLNVGGVIGQNNMSNSLPLEQNAIKAKDIKITTSVDGVNIGGIYGHNKGVTTKTLSTNFTVHSSGRENSIGGSAGLNTGSLLDSTVENASITSSGQASYIGGGVGYSEGAAEQSAVVKNVIVIAKEKALITAEGTKSKIGGIIGYGAHTDILNPQIYALTPDVARVLVRSTEIYAGGIAGYLEQSKIIGNTQAVNVANTTKTNVENVLITTTVSSPLIPATATKGSQIGGITGYNDETRIDQVVGRKVNITVNGEDTVVGGIAGYNKGTDKAIIKDSYVLDLNIVVNQSAKASVVGGMIGRNAGREIDNPSPSYTPPVPSKGISSIQGSRTVGVVNVNAPSTVTGGLVGENSTLIANNSIADKNTVSSRGHESQIGGLVGLNTDKGTIYYTYSNAILVIEGHGTVAGGLVGQNDGSVLASYIDNDVTARNYTPANSAPLFVGGLVGKNTGTVDKSYTNTKVTANAPNTFVGGLIGLHEAGTVSNSYVGQEVSATGANSYAGGLIGKLMNGQISTSYSAAQVKAATNFAGGFIGYYENNSKDLLSKNYYLKDEVFNKDLPDFAEGKHRWLNAPTRLSTIHRDTLKDRIEFPDLSRWDFSGTWRYGSPNAAYLFPELNRTANTGGERNSEGETGNIVNANINWYIQDQQKPAYDIGTEAELAGLAAIVNGMIPGVNAFDFKDRTIRITKTIHIQSNQWIPIGLNKETPFQGTFNGTEKLIHGLKIGTNVDLPLEEYAGFFGVIGESALIQNVKLEADAVTGKGDTGVLAGLNEGRITNAQITLLDGASVKGQTVGGIIGNNKGTVSHLVLTMDEESRIEAVANEAIVGGIIGENSSNITATSYKLNQLNGSIGSMMENTIVGGIIGKQTAGDVSDLSVEITDNYKLSTTGMNNTVGGVIGYYESGRATGIIVTFVDGMIKASGRGSTIGTVIGESARDNIIEQIIVLKDNTETTHPQVKGTAIIGGIVGEKEGQGSSTFDISNVTVENVVIASTEDSNEELVVAGIAGKLTNTAMKKAYFDGQLSIVSPSKVAAGGIVGQADQSILFDVEALPEIVSTATDTNEHIIGGIAGIVSSIAGDRDKALDFGLNMPLYYGIYDAKVHQKEIGVKGHNNQTDLYVGGLVGQNNNASIYFSQSSTKLNVEEAKHAFVGGVVGQNNSGIIVQTKALADLDTKTSVNYLVGGFVGKSIHGEIHYSNVNEGKIVIGSAKGKDDTTFVGGFVGSAQDTIITNSYADIPIAVTCTNSENVIYVGGFAGILDESLTNNGLLERVYAKGDLKVSGKVMSYVGGFVGYINQYKIKDAYASGNINNTGFDTRSGGFAGVVERNAVITNALANTASIKVTGTNNATRAYAGGFAGLNDGQLISVESFVKQEDITISNIRVANDANVRKNSLVAYNFTRGVINPNGSVLPVSLPYGEWLTEPDAKLLLGPNNTELQIPNVRQLSAAVILYNDNVSEMKYYPLFNRSADKLLITKIALTNHIVIEEGKVWLPIAEFKADALFEGNQKTISNLALLQETLAYRIHPGIYSSIEQDRANTGFIASNEGVMQNVRFENVLVQGKSNTGAVAGLNQGTLSNITVSGMASVSGDNVVGGIVGSNSNDGTISTLVIQNLTLVGKNYLGGIAGSNTGTIENSKLMKFDVNGEKQIGGTAGSNTGILTELTLGAGTITGQEELGGVSGNNLGEISKVTSTQSIVVSGTKHLGGVAGSNEATHVIQDVKMTDVKVEGTELLGGIAGVNAGTIREVELMKFNVNGEKQIGGITGTNTGTLTELTLGTGAITGQEELGGITGNNAGEISKVTSTQSIVVSGTKHLGGVAGNNEVTHVIQDVKMTDVKVEGTELLGGIAGANAGTIREVELMKFNVNGEKQIGGISGTNTGTLTELTLGAGTITGPEEIGGVSGSNAGEISKVTSTQRIIVSGTKHLGGVAGNNEATHVIQNVKMTDVKVEGTELLGGIAGVNAGTIREVELMKFDVIGEKQIGGISGSNTGTLTELTLGDGTITGQEELGGVAGNNAGEISKVTSTQSIVVSGTKHLGGVAGSNSATHVIQDVKMTDVKVEGTELLGGITGTNAGIIDTIEIGKVTINDGDFVGGVTGKNNGEISQASVNGFISSKGSFIGGIAGLNEGTVEKSFARGIMSGSNSTETIIGGIAGENSGQINHSFSFQDITATSKIAKVGGVAGISSGNIADVYNSGRVNGKAIGEENTKVWAGGIVGHASNGTISNALNYAEVVASIGDKIVPQQSFFGGIAGQNSGATITSSAFNKQMLKANTAYYGHDGKRVSGNNEEARGLVSSLMTNGTYNPNQAVWKTTVGFYPQLVGFSADVTKLSTTAVIIDDQEVMSRVKSDFTLTNDNEVVWSADPAQAISGSLIGSLDRVTLTASVNGMDKVFLVNAPALLFHEKAEQPNVVSNPSGELFQEKVTVTLSSTEENATIYYTLDGSIPYPNEGSTELYTGPIELSETTTLLVITIAEDKEPSDVLTKKWTKSVPTGGGVPSPIVPPPVVPSETTINGQPVNGETKNGILTAYFGPEDVAQTSTKEIVIEGKDTTIKGYSFTFDQAILSQAVQEEKNIRIDVPQANLVVTTKMLKNMKEALEVTITPNAEKDVSRLSNLASSVSATLLGNGQGVTIQTNIFVNNQKQYVNASVPVPNGILANAITAVVLHGSDGNWTTIPWKHDPQNRGKIQVRLTGNGTISFMHNAKTFVDVLENSWSRQSITEASSKLFVLGKRNNIFDPNNKVTRAEYPTILLRVAGFMNQNASASFSDVRGNDWFNRSVAIASDMGIVYGISPGTFAPYQTLTRVEGMTMVGRVLDVLGISEQISDSEVEAILSTFKDGNSVPIWARKSTALTIKYGIIVGEDNHINPQNHLTRAQATAIAVRLEQLIIK